MYCLAWPRIVAESLRVLRQPAPAGTQRPVAADVDVVLAALRAAQAPSRYAPSPPSFLHPSQHDPWRRIMSALEAWHGALLLERVGTGKTWIALAVAACEARPGMVIVPAILQEQWRDAARRARVTLQIWTHERASRGNIPDTTAQLVIIDEAHRLRDHGTRRVQTIAPWLVGRRVLLLTATPIVNRLAELIALLRLAVAEDALALDGIPRLGDLELLSRPATALRRVAIRSSGMGAAMVHRCVIPITPDADENRRGRGAVAAIRQLELSTCTAIRRLLTAVLLDAAASSDAAFHQALKRYRALLLQAQDAGGASRAMLRRFAGDALDQLVLWPLLATDAPAGELPLADIPRVELLLAIGPRDEEWIKGLVARCDDTRPTICFSRHRATARRLREALGEATAWITGSDAGIGPHRVGRDAVLAAFGPRRETWRVRREAPRMLVATDVAAEGLDLHAAGRIVHVDLPWTAMRVEQREGRLVRLGQRHANVEVVVRMPATPIESALAPHARIRRKHRLADEWLRALETDDTHHCSGVAGPMVASLQDDGEPAALVAVRLQRDRHIGAMIMVQRRGDGWCCDDALARELVHRARTAASVTIDPDRIAAQLSAASRAALAACVTAEPNAPPALVSRIHRLARPAAASRDGSALRRLDRLLRFVTASPTAGARMIVARLADLDDREFLHAEVHEMAARGSVQATPIVVLLFRSAAPPLR
jgi:superfamily II DNA or RNA helicase